MRTWRVRLRLWALAGLSLIVLGCGGGGGGSGPTKSESLFEHNAQFNDGRTVRWPNLPIQVFLGNGVASAGEVTAWTGATGGAVTFAFVGSAGGANITYTFRSGTDICGVTFVEFTDGGIITSAEVRVSQSIYRTSVCVRTVTHETGHAIGFLNHTADGGLMDDDGGDGQFTPLTTGVIQQLYSLGSGSVVSALAPRLTERRVGGRRTMVFVTRPIRR